MRDAGRATLGPHGQAVAKACPELPAQSRAYNQARRWSAFESLGDARTVVLDVFGPVNAIRLQIFGSIGPPAMRYLDGRG